MKDNICTASSLHNIVNLHKNKARTKCLKIKQGQTKELFQDSISEPLTFIDEAFKALEDATQTPVVSKSKEVLEKKIDNPLQKEKETTFEVAGEISLPLRPKQTPGPTPHNAKQKEATKNDKDDEDYVFKFIDDYICKPLERNLKMY
ncbi:hypothetical protein E6C27_scaffold24G002610 [Cucumis melo var. makuwa]|uniref:Uncharacterized protein n=1 Tax=Cucumis melo var. makuwa TaxID=1194695 RepID=A0A5A7UFD5_CUCMM|nr:hypothetical protein E6C27_scaffold24G002610 [Cucumis melo var. makuwa]